MKVLWYDPRFGLLGYDARLKFFVFVCWINDTFERIIWIGDDE